MRQHKNNPTVVQVTEFLLQRKDAFNLAAIGKQTDIEQIHNKVRKIIWFHKDEAERVKALLNGLVDDLHNAGFLGTPKEESTN